MDKIEGLSDVDYVFVVYNHTAALWKTYPEIKNVFLIEQDAIDLVYDKYGSKEARINLDLWYYKKMKKMHYEIDLEQEKTRKLKGFLL